MTILTTLNLSGNVVSYGSKFTVSHTTTMHNNTVFTGLNEDGAGDGNRTHVSSLGSSRTAIVRHPLELRDCGRGVGGWQWFTKW
jgi:hypothetical protein